MERWWDRGMWFWMALVGAVLAIAGYSIFHHRSPASTPNGYLMVALAAAYFLWFAVTPSMLRGRLRIFGFPWHRGSIPGFPENSLDDYALLCLGLVLTVALVLLRSEFLGMVYVFMGIAFMALPVRSAISASLIMLPAFLYSMGITQGMSVGVWGEGLSLLSVAGVCFSLTTVMRQRNQRGALIGELKAAHEELRVKAAQDVELAALRERNRLAREMHDSIGHALVLISMKMEAVQRLAAVDPDRASTEFKDIQSLVRSTMGELRHSLAGLRPPALTEGSLQSALTGLTVEMDHNSDINVQADIHGDVNSLPDSTQEAVYRVVQEGLSNVAKHARAQQAWVHVTRGGGKVVLSVEDDGIGLEGGIRRTDSQFGIEGMRERILALGGSLTIRGRSTGGCSLEVLLPDG